MMSGEALEFAPGLLSIQESPPGKLPKTILYLVMILFALLLLWAIFGKLDIVATTEGRLIPKSYVKIVQPSEGGIVEEILVHEGQTVHAGEALMRMDANSTLSDSMSVEGEMRIRDLQMRRIEAELGNIPLLQQKNDPIDVYLQTQQQYQANRKAYLDAVSQGEQLHKKDQEDLVSAQEVLRKLEQTLPMYRKNAIAYDKLAKEGFVNKVEAEDKERERIEKEQDYRAQKSTVGGLYASVSASEKRLRQITSDYRSKLENERSDVQSQYKKLTQEWGKNLHKSALLELKAPQNGVIKDLITHTQGSVVSPGTVLMSLVPSGDVMQAEVMIKNEDVGFVHPGQHVKIKLIAYPFQKYGMLEGSVMNISADSMQGQTTAQGIPADKSEQSQASSLTYKALIKLDTQYLSLEEKHFDLTSGMQVTAEIHLGKRTVMEYLLSPIQKAWQEAGRER